MDPIKKRRNSILKKKTEEDTTTEIKSRRISFSGKKSIKEFIAGDAAETIWGTSYEESADDLKVSSSESGLVNLNVKRIQLRNRRVVCDPPQQPNRRSSLKKKVLIAENDKENLCVKLNPTVLEIVEIPPEVKPPLALATIEQPQNVSNAIRETMTEKNKMRVVDCSSICSSTFDFINFSAQINKTITIEESLDVSLNDSELKMFKFRVPVTATEISPNTSNVLCRSILMSEDDVNILKMVRNQKGGINAIKEQIIDSEMNLIETKKRDAEITDMSKTNIEKTMMQCEKTIEINVPIASDPMEVSHINDGKGSKRKSERTPHSLVLDPNLLEVNSPMRKKPMHHTLYLTSMDVTNNLITNSTQNEQRPTDYKSVGIDESISSHKPAERPTIHFDSVAIKESAVDMHLLSVSNIPSHTIYDSKTLNESSSFPNTTAACLAMGNQTDDISMELSIYSNKVRNDIETKAQTIHYSPDIQMEYSLDGRQQLDQMNMEHIEQTQPSSIVKNSETIYDCSDVEEITMPTNQVIKHSKNQKESISIYMDAECPKPSKNVKTNQTKGLKLRQTILTPEEIIEDSPRDTIEPKSVLQKTIISTINICEDSIELDSDTNRNKKDRRTLYDPIEIQEDIISIQQPNAPSNKNKEKRQSIYTSTDMIEESPQPSGSKINSKTGLKERQIIFNQKDIPTNSIGLDTTSKQSARNRQTICGSDDIEVETEPYQRSLPLSKINNARKSIYTPSDMIADTTECTLTSQEQSKRIVLSGNLNPRVPSNKNKEKRESIYTATDMIEESPKPCGSKINSKTGLRERQIIFNQKDISTNSIGLDTTSNPSARNRQTICGSDDIEVDTEPNQSSLPLSKINNARKSIYTPSDMIADTPECTLTSQEQSKRIVSSGNLNPRHTIFTPVDIFEDDPNKCSLKNCHQKIVETSLAHTEESVQAEAVFEPVTDRHLSSRTNKSRESIYTPSDMIEDSPRPIRIEPKSSKDIKTCQPIFTPEDILEDNYEQIDSKSLVQKTIKTPIHIFEDTPPKLNEVVKNRQTIYDITDIEEDNANINHATSSCVVNKRRKSINIQSKIILDDLEETEDLSVVSKASMANNSSKTNVKRQTTYNQLDISLDPKIQNNADIEVKNDQKPRTTICTPTDIVVEFPKVTKQREPSKIKVFRRQLSSTDLPSKKSQQPQPEKIQQNEAVNSTQLKPQCASQFSFAVHQEKLKKRQSIHIPVDMVEDSPKPVKPIEPSKPKMIVRQLEDESTDIDTDSIVEKIHQKTIKNQADIVIDSPVNITAKSLKENQRKTIHTPLEMMEDSPKLKNDSEENAVETYENKQIIQEIDEQVDKRHALSFRKPTKLFSETYKSLEKPCSSAKSLMDKVMQEMGYSMNFQLEFPPKEESPKLPQSQQIDLTKELCKSMNLSLEDNSINLSIDDEINSKNQKRQTICSSENIEVDHIQNKNKTSFDGSLMEMSSSDGTIGSKEKINFQHNNISQSLTLPQINSMQHLSQLSDETINNKKPKLFENETSICRQITDESMGLSIPKSHNSVLRESAFARPSPQDIDEATETYANNNMEIQNDENQQDQPKAQSKRQTIYFNQDLDVEDRETNTVKDKDKIIQQSANKIVSSQTMFVDQDLEIEEQNNEYKAQVSIANVPSYISRKTIHCHEDLEVVSPKQSTIISASRKPLNRMEINKGNDVQQEPRRRTLHLNEDLELDESLNQTESSLKPPLHRSNQQTMNLNKYIEHVEEVKIKDHSSTKQLSFQAKKQESRKTILMNQDLDVSEIVDSQRLPSQISSQDNIKNNQRFYHDGRQKIDIQTIQQSPNRQTVHFHQDLDVSDVNDMPENTFQIPSGKCIKTNGQINYSKNQGIHSEDISRRPNRQTIHFSEDHDICEMNESHNDQRIDSQDISRRPIRQTIHFNEDHDICEMNESQNDSNQRIDSQHISERPNRQTIHFNEDHDMCEMNESQNVPSHPPSRVANKTNNFNQVVDESQLIQQRSNRQTIHYKQDLDISQIDDMQKVTPQIPSREPMETKRRTNYVNENLEIDECQQTSTQAIPHSQQTINFKQGLEGNDNQQQISSKFSNHRQTILVSQELDMSIGEQSIPSNKALNAKTNSKQSGRQTIYFEQKLEIDNENYTVDKSIKNQQLRSDQNKASLHQEIQSHDDYTMRKKLFNETQKNTEENACRFPLTDCNNYLDERTGRLEEREVTAKIASKPRRVTICDAQPLDMDESLLPKPTARKSSYSRTLNFDEVPKIITTDETSHQKSTLSIAKNPKVNCPSTTIQDDESPIYNSSLRRKCPMTPSEVDRSLAEYLKVEAALEDEDEEIFYDAEDGTDCDKQKKQRQTCYVPVNIFEESGMQPILSQPLKRQTTFSPRKMMNDESLVDDGQTKLAVCETNTEFSTHHNETPQKSSSIILESRLGGFNIDVQKNRKTLHLNESINTADVASTWKPSSAVQSFKELLLENTRLFSQSNLIKPSILENKRSTIFYAGNDDSMDVSCIGPTDPECTPTKNKISRIPQLIGSAKKLESLKKSMEFIQQELPNIGSHLRNKTAYEDVEDFAMDSRKLSTPSPKKLQELDESSDAMEVCQKLQTEESSPKEVRQLQQSFDTIDIPRKILSNVRKTLEEFPQKELAREKGEKPYDGDEIHQRTINASALEESFDIVDIPRRGTTFQRNDTLYICPNEKETTMNASQKSLFHLEDPPITISDVSTFFSNQKFLSNEKHAAVTYSPNTTSALCKLNMNEIQALSRSPDSEDTTHNLAHFKKRYVELTCDSISLPDSIDNIENTHFSLVNTIDDESEMVVQIPPEIQIESESLHPVKEQRLKPNSSVCRKCKCRRLSTTNQNDTTMGSFTLEPLPVYKVDLSKLEQLAKQPSIADVGTFWRQKIRESDSFNVSDSSLSMAIDGDDSESIEHFLTRLADERLAKAKCREEKRKAIKFENSFRFKVRQKIQSKPNWMINELLLFNNIIVLTHTRIRTFAIIIYFTPKDPRGVEVTFNDIQLKQNKLHSLQWKPYEYALHYQLLVELPFDLKKICPTSEHFFDFLEHFEKVTEDVLRIGKEMLSLVLPSPASLIREPSGRLYIRKYVRTKTPQNDVKRTEVHIEVRNIKKISYESIVMPPLYEFNESIQLLPLGIDFLRKFLNDPLRFIKT